MTRQFKYSGWHAPDVVQTLDGQVWVSIIPPEPGLWNTWVEVERIQSAKGCRFDRGAYEYPFGGFGTRTGRSNGDSFWRPDPKPESKYGIRDHRPMSDAERRQARLYTMSVHDIDPEALRKLIEGME